MLPEAIVTSMMHAPVLAGALGNNIVSRFTTKALCIILVMNYSCASWNGIKKKTRNLSNHQIQSNYVWTLLSVAETRGHTVQRWFFSDHSPQQINTWEYQLHSWGATHSWRNSKTLSTNPLQNKPSPWQNKAHVTYTSHSCSCVLLASRIRCPTPNKKVPTHMLRLENPLLFWNIGLSRMATFKKDFKGNFSSTGSNQCIGLDGRDTPDGV